jgi:hypothetical protein
MIRATIDVPPRISESQAVISESKAGLPNINVKVVKCWQWHTVTFFED